MLSVVIPVYNEEKVILETISKIKEQLSKIDEKSEIICVNDCSKDKSGQILSTIKGIKVITHRSNRGYGASLKDGFRIAKGEKILIIDADGTYPIEHIPRMHKASLDVDMVVGSRDHSNVPLIRRPAKKFLNIMANFLTGKKIPDLNSGMRIFSKELAMRFIHLFPDGFSLTSTITLAALTSGYSVRYIPIPYYKRIGKSSIKAWDFFNFLLLIVRIVMYFHPLKFFLLPGALIFLLGGFYGLYQVIVISNIAQLPILLIITGLQICFLGLLADLVVKSRSAR